MHPTKSQKPLKQQPKNPGRRNREERESRDKAENERKQARAEAAAAEAAVEAAGRRAQYGIPSTSAQQQLPQQPYQQQKRLRGRGGPARGGRGGFMGERGSRLDQQPPQGLSQTRVDSGQNDNAKGKTTAAPVAPISPRGVKARQSTSAVANIPADVSAPSHSPAIVKTELGDSGSVPHNVDAQMGNTESDVDTKMKTENADGTYPSSDHDETAEDHQFNIEYINLISDEDDIDDVMDGDARDIADGGRRRVSVLAPVRLQRREHEERNIAVTTSKDAINASSQPHHSREDMSPSTTRDKSAKRGDVGSSGSTRKWKGVYEDADEERSTLKSKRDDGSAGPGAGFRRGIGTEVEEYDDTSDGHSHGEDSDTGIRVNRSTKTGQGKLREAASTKKQPTQPVFHTIAEKREWERRENDLRTMREELGQIQVEESDDTNHSYTRKDAVYLFQFPPILADLHGPTVKIEDIDAATSTVSAVQHDNSENASETAAKVKEDPVEIEDDDESAGAVPQDDPRFRPGYVGKLRIRKSGRAELVWGGNNLEVSIGTEATFPQTPMLMRYNNSNGRNVKGSENETEYHGDAICMGQVRGKLIVTPDWDKLLR